MLLARQRVTPDARWVAPRLTPEEFQEKARVADEASAALLLSEESEATSQRSSAGSSREGSRGTEHAATQQACLVAVAAHRNQARNRRKKTKTPPAALLAASMPHVQQPSASEASDGTEAASPGAVEGASDAYACACTEAPAAATPHGAAPAAMGSATMVPGVACGGEQAAALSASASGSVPADEALLHADGGGAIAANAVEGAAGAGAVDVSDELSHATPAAGGAAGAPTAATATAVAEPRAEIPEAFYCPISQALMSDPVVTCDGFTFERHAITEWLSRSSSSPLTGAPLAHGALIPNGMARSLIREFAERNRSHPDCNELLERIARSNHAPPDREQGT